MTAVLAVALLLQAPAALPAPASASFALAERVARGGALAGLMAAVGGEQAREVVDAHPELSPGERERARAVAAAALGDAKHEIALAEARALDATLSPAELQAAATFFDSAAGRAYRSAFPRILLEVAQIPEAKDFKGYVTTRVCDETRVCPSERPSPSR